MDVPSDVIAAMRIGRAQSARVEHHGPFGKRLPTTVPAVGCHVIRHGTCWPIPPHSAPIRLNVGDVTLLRHGVVSRLVVWATSLDALR
ncbi:cupin domain-containing protein [Streptomyces sp. NBC_00365]|uniref:cupin domain-containing protein n=1 Tax=Streptomyces sp. NBC_00365 TaxID=2975726 RepID=UPI0022531BC8|nr:cupin domain-containing protein [Streptomyces sp. NBC_00365]MCX5093932.1 cupin domain-containing protein [Streptomyces sp. NBC_00365]